jgi:hypothetical protein
MISTLLFFQMPTHEYVVPRSMPMAGPSIFLFFVVGVVDVVIAAAISYS